MKPRAARGLKQDEYALKYQHLKHIKVVRQMRHFLLKKLNQQSLITGQSGIGFL